MPEHAFLSVRVPAETRNRLRALAADRGESLQEIVGRALRDLLARDADAAPDAGRIVAGLREAQGRLQAEGIRHLWLVGSLARGEAGTASDIDLMAEFEETPPLTLVRLARLTQDLKERLGRPVDLLDRKPLPKEARTRLDREAIAIF